MSKEHLVTLLASSPAIVDGRHWSFCQTNLQPKEAERLLQKRGKVGTYMICPLADTPHSYTLSVGTGDKVHHVTIRKENEVFHDSEGSQFESLSKLVQCYKENPILRDTDKRILLKEPLYSTSFLPLYITHQVRILEKESHGQSGFQKEFQKLVLLSSSMPQLLSPYTSVEAVGVQYIYECPEPEPYNPRSFWGVVQRKKSDTVVTLRNGVEVVQELLSLPSNQGYTSFTYSCAVDLTEDAVKSLYKIETIEFNDDIFATMDYSLPFRNRSPKHFDYTAWPKKGVPLDPGSVAEFLHDVHEHWRLAQQSNGPIVVRSTVDRVGIFLVLHCLVHAITSKAGRYSDMNVYKAAQLVMDKSGGFTLTEEQYRFIYATMQSYVEAHKEIFATNSRTFATGEYVDDPDYFHSSEPELSSEDSGSEGASTEKDVEKNGLAEERQLKDDDSKQLFEEAMEKGYVDTRLVIFLLIGAAGSGKTHVKHLALQLPPPLFRQSTPLAEMPIRAISLWRATVKGSSTKWFPVGPDEFTKMIVEAIKAGVPRGIIPFPWLLSVPPVPPMIGQRETPSPSLNELADQAPQQAVDIPPTSSEAVTLPPNTSHELADVDSSSDEDRPPSPALSEEDSTAKLEEELVHLISKASGSKRLLEVDWVHLIDSGGQPQFHEILPAFVRNASAAVFVSKLNEQLRQRPTVEYYGKDGQKCGSSYSSLLTHEQILRHSFRAMQSRLCTSSTGRSPKVFVVGTHKDREGECEETRAQKNERLLNMLRPVFQDNLAIYRKSEPDELMYPVDAKHPGEEDRKVADALRQAVMKMCNEDRVKIPLPWFVFEQFVRQLAAERDVGLISLEECRKISRRLHMSEESFRAALKYLVGLNIFFYYPDLLPEIVFCESQVVLDKISELVELSHTLRGKSDSPALDIELCQGAEWERFRYHGILTVELLKEFPKHYSAGLFTCHDLLKLLKGLLIVAQVSNMEHIMPCVLPELSAEEVTTHRLLDPTSPCTPLLVQYQDKWVPSGVFTILIAYLQNEAHWQVVLRYGSPVCLYRNCVKFKLPTGQRGAVAVIDSFEYLEVHVQTTHTTCSRLCFQIRQDVFQGLDKAADVLGYEGLKPQEAFFCLQRDTTCDTTFHLACLQEDEWICSVNPEVGGELTDQHRVWLESFPESHTSTTTPTGQKHHRTLQEPSSAVIPHSSDVPMLHQLQCLQVRSTTVRVIDTVAAKWEDIAIALHFNTPDIETVKWDTRLLAVPACRTVFQKWLKGEGCKPVSWGRLIEALIAATFINLAEQLQEILKD